MAKVESNHGAGLYAVDLVPGDALAVVSGLRGNDSKQDFRVYHSPLPRPRRGYASLRIIHAAATAMDDSITVVAVNASNSTRPLVSSLKYQDSTNNPSHVPVAAGNYSIEVSSSADSPMLSTKNMFLFDGMVYTLIVGDNVTGGKFEMLATLDRYYSATTVLLRVIYLGVGSSGPSRIALTVSATGSTETVTFNETQFDQKAGAVSEYRNLTFPMGSQLYVSVEAAVQMASPEECFSKLLPTDGLVDGTAWTFVVWGGGITSSGGRTICSEPVRLEDDLQPDPSKAKLRVIKGGVGIPATYSAVAGQHGLQLSTKTPKLGVYGTLQPGVYRLAPDCAWQTPIPKSCFANATTRVDNHTVSFNASGLYSIFVQDSAVTAAPPAGGQFASRSPRLRRALRSLSPADPSDGDTAPVSSAGGLNFTYKCESAGHGQNGTDKMACDLVVGNPPGPFKSMKECCASCGAGAGGCGAPSPPPGPGPPGPGPPGPAPPGPAPPGPTPQGMCENPALSNLQVEVPCRDGMECQRRVHGEGFILTGIDLQTWNEAAGEWKPGFNPKGPQQYRFVFAYINGATVNVTFIATSLKWCNITAMGPGGNITATGPSPDSRLSCQKGSGVVGEGIVKCQKTIAIKSGQPNPFTITVGPFVDEPGGHHQSPRSITVTPVIASGYPFCPAPPPPPPLPKPPPPPPPPPPPLPHLRFVDGDFLDKGFGASRSCRLRFLNGGFNSTSILQISDPSGSSQLTGEFRAPTGLQPHPTEVVVYTESGASLRVWPAWQVTPQKLDLGTVPPNTVVPLSCPPRCPLAESVTVPCGDSGAATVVLARATADVPRMFSLFKVPDHTQIPTVCHASLRVINAAPTFATSIVLTARQDGTKLPLHHLPAYSPTESREMVAGVWSLTVDSVAMNFTRDFTLVAGVSYSLYLLADDKGLDPLLLTDQTYKKTTAFVRLAHAAPMSGPVDLTIKYAGADQVCPDAQRVRLGPASYGDATAYRPVSIYQQSAVVATTQTANANFTIGSGNWTIYAVPSSAMDSSGLELGSIRDLVNFSGVSADGNGLRWLNAVPGAPPANVSEAAGWKPQDCDGKKCHLDGAASRFGERAVYGNVVKGKRTLSLGGAVKAHGSMVLDPTNGGFLGPREKAGGMYTVVVTGDSKETAELKLFVDRPSALRSWFERYYLFLLLGLGLLMIGAIFCWRRRRRRQRMADELKELLEKEAKPLGEGLDEPLIESQGAGAGALEQAPTVVTAAAEPPAAAVKRNRQQRQQQRRVPRESNAGIQ
jgi:hypothetical protein